MTNNRNSQIQLIRKDQKNGNFPYHTQIIRRISRALDIPEAGDDRFITCLPFGEGDITGGAENEFQTVVEGDGESVDLPVTIRESNYYKNLLKRTDTGEMSRKVICRLDQYLRHNREKVWENSWVRFPSDVLSPYAKDVFTGDLLKDKNNPDSQLGTVCVREDAPNFFFRKNGREFIRIPVSYLLKLALADAISREDSEASSRVKETGIPLLRHFLNDNTSPEVFSFYPAWFTKKTQNGKTLARETQKRFLLTQLLVQYANTRFLLKAHGQRAVVYFASCPHTRQKMLNTLISDAFYRELFMSPCLSGWSRGEEKKRYMALCHQVLSRSRLNAVSKLKDAGIITRNLVVLPNVSDTSLANNGTHISLGSRKLTCAMQDPGSGFGASEEKYIGDLVIKIVEHFLPLFVGTYSAAPYRLEFRDFHPERALGFLSHELDYTHLRMIWRRWKKKAKLKVFGHPVTPLGPEMSDLIISRIFGLKGDMVPDFRLIDYLISLMSTYESPALNGMVENEKQWKRDLQEFGVFDTEMPAYLLYRMRTFAGMGFSGFEGRYYSLFEDLESDMGNAANLQALVTALAYQYIFSGKIHHIDIPDNPVVESERRQIFFGTAIGIPTFFVHKNTRNRFMRMIIGQTPKTRMSRRYNGYIRVYNHEYRKALLRMIRKDGKGLVEMAGMEDTLQDAEERLMYPCEKSASGKIVSSILAKTGAKNPMDLSALEFNQAAESCYREDLRKNQMQKALDSLREDIFRMMNQQSPDMVTQEAREHLVSVCANQAPFQFLKEAEKDLLEETLDVNRIMQCIHLVLLSLKQDMKENSKPEEKNQYANTGASVY